MPLASSTKSAFVKGAIEIRATTFGWGRRSEEDAALVV